MHLRAPPAQLHGPGGRPRHSFAGEHAAGDRDVFAAGFLGHRDRVGERALLADLGKLDQHGKVDACEHFDLGPAHAGNGEIRWRAAEHVGQDGDAVAGVDTVHGFDDVAATEIRVVVCTNRHGFYLFLRTHDMFERRSEFVGEAPMGHQYQANHWILLAGALGAPHERATLTIQSPYARGDVYQSPGI
ncbi:hypothetical protein BRAS3843_1020019 [Bradyrhizobium sp. STM 3843]|nr:hypothetical protein BRAS3843_1020019 [Bradyrhizobium sp. STM 3843]